MAEMHSNLSDHRCNCSGRFRLSLKHQPGTQILLTAGNLSGSVVKTFDWKGILDVSDVTRILITTSIKSPVSATLSLFDYIHIFMACSVRSILILFSHLQPRLLRALLHFLRLKFCHFFILATYKAHPIMLEMFVYVMLAVVYQLWNFNMWRSTVSCNSLPHKSECFAQYSVFRHPQSFSFLPIWGFNKRIKQCYFI